MQSTPSRTRWSVQAWYSSRLPSLLFLRLCRPSAAEPSRRTKEPTSLGASLRHVVERRARRYQRLTRHARLKFLEQPVEVRHGPRVNVHWVVRLAFLRIRDQVDQMRIGQRQGRVAKVPLLHQHQFEILPLDPVHLLAVPQDESLAGRLLLLAKKKPRLIFAVDDALIRQG